MELLSLFSRPDHVAEVKLDGRELIGFVARLL